MKKLLSILGAMGLVATAGASVVACGETSVDNNPSVNYKTFDGWVQDSKGTNEIVFIGGRTDSDSLSFLGAVESMLKDTPSNYNTMIDQNHLNDIDSNFTNNFLLHNSSSTKYNGLISAVQGSFLNVISNISNDPLDQGNSGTIKSYLWNDEIPDSESVKDVRLHSILVDDVSSFFKSGLGKDIVSKFINDQVKASSDWYYSSENQKKPDQKQINTQIKATQKGIKSTLEATNGPIFLLITNGKLVGISNGFKNYTKYNSDMAKDPEIKNGSQSKDYQLSSPQAAKDLSTLFSYFGKAMLSPLASWLENNWLPNKNGSQKLVISDKDISTSLGDKTWDKSNQNKKYDPSAPSDSSDGKDNSNSDSSNTKSFAIDPAKYIN